MKQRIRRTILLSAVALSGLLASGWSDNPPATQPSSSGVRLFITGHSFHQGLIPLMERIALAANITNEVLVGKLIVGGSRVIQVWNNSATESNVRAALQAGQVDVLTVAPHRLLPDPGIDQFVKLGRAGNPQLRVTVQQSWMPYDDQTGQAKDPDPENKPPTNWDAMTGPKLLALSELYFRELDHQLVAINQQYGPVVFLVPTARAVIALREKVRLGQVPGIKTQAALFVDRMGHPGAAITALNAYCHFAVIYRRSPVGLPPLCPLPDIPPTDCAALNRLLQEIAWETVSTTPLTGVSAAQ